MDLATKQGIREIVLTGDFNADKESNEPESRNLESFLTKFSLYQHMDKPTRTDPVTGKKSILDLIITNHRATVQRTESTDPLHLNDHNTISAVLQLKLHKQRAYTRRMWDYAKADFNAFRAKLTNADWDSCFRTEDVDVAVETWNNIFMEAATTSIPNKLVTVHPNDHPWYKGNLRRLKREKNRLFRENTRADTPESLRNYRDARNSYLISLQYVKRSLNMRVQSSNP
jgi:ribosomal protein L31